MLCDWKLRNTQTAGKDTAEPRLVYTLRTLDNKEASIITADHIRDTFYSIITTDAYCWLSLFVSGCFGCSRHITAWPKYLTHLK